jgi:hypothetical protein
MSMKNSNDIFGNRTRDLPVCSAVPQPTAPLCVHEVAVSLCKCKNVKCIICAQFSVKLQIFIPQFLIKIRNISFDVNPCGGSQILPHTHTRALAHARTHSGETWQRCLFIASDLRMPVIGKSLLKIRSTVKFSGECCAVAVDYSETSLCWPPFVPFKAAQLIHVANIWVRKNLALWKFNCILSLVQMYSSECTDRQSSWKTVTVLSWVRRR